MNITQGESPCLGRRPRRAQKSYAVRQKSIRFVENISRPRPSHTGVKQAPAGISALQAKMELTALRRCDKMLTMCGYHTPIQETESEWKEETLCIGS